MTRPAALSSGSLPAEAPRESGAIAGAVVAALRDGSGVAPTVSVTVPAPVVPVDALLSLGEEGAAVLWAPRCGAAWAGFGAAVEIAAGGDGRFAAVRREAEALFAGLRVVSLGHEAPPPRLFGGFAFRPGGARTPVWMPFGDARFFLPRLQYAQDGSRAWLTVSAGSAGMARPAERAALVAELERAQEALRSAAHTVQSAPTALRAPSHTEEVTEAQWRELVENVRACIASGVAEKIVVARRTSLGFEQPLDAREVLADLAESASGCTRFAFRYGRSVFLGATPERLVSKRGLRLETEALAGSSRPGSDRYAAELLESSKELGEHQVVLREIVQCLSPFCDSISHPEGPAVRSLRHVIHLSTPIAARLRRPTHILDLVDRLHPTPAVGGVPRREALQWIAEHEATERGWYAAPVGWLDASGDGEFDVALRSGVLEDAGAHLYAGSGIVRDSDPESEYAETRLKLASLLSALRVAG